MASGKLLSSNAFMPVYRFGDQNGTSSSVQTGRSMLSNSSLRGILRSPGSPIDTSSRYPVKISKFTTSHMQAAFQNEMEAANLGTSISLQSFDLLPKDVQDHFHDQMREAERLNDQERIAALIDMLPSKKLVLEQDLSSTLPQNGASKRHRVSFGVTGPINQRARPNGTTPLVFRKTIAGRISYYILILSVFILDMFIVRLDYIL